MKQHVPILLALGVALVLSACEKKDTAAIGDTSAEATPVKATDAAPQPVTEPATEPDALAAAPEAGDAGATLTPTPSKPSNDLTATPAGAPDQPPSFSNQLGATLGADATKPGAAASKPVKTATSSPGLKPSAEANALSDRNAKTIDPTTGLPRSQPTPSGPIVVTVEPAQLDLGEIPTDDSKSGVVRLTNTGDTARTLLNARASCNCTAVDFPKGSVLDPGQSVEVTISLNGGQRPMQLRKQVTFVIEGQDPLILPVTGQSVAFVSITPARLDPETMPDGRVVLKAEDGQPFRITSMQPKLVEELPEEPQVEHELFLDWDTWRELGSRRKLLFYLDHPKTIRLYADAIAPRTQVPPKPVVKPMPGDQVDRVDPNAVKPTKPKSMPTPPANYDQLIRMGQTAGLIAQIQGGKLDVDTRDRSNNTLLSLASQHGATDLMQVLVDAGADIEAPGQLGRTPLMFAAQSKNVDAVKLLLDHGADVTARDEIGGTPLSWAAGIGDAASVAALIEADSEVDAANTIMGFTPLIWAALSGEPASVQLLIDAEADLEAVDNLEGATALMHAVRTGKLESVNALIAAGANLEARDRTGRTALLMAASQSGATAAKLQALLDAAADVHATDNRGRGALEYARSRTDPRAGEVVRLLESVLGVEDAGEEEPATPPAEPPAEPAGDGG